MATKRHADKGKWAEKAVEEWLALQSASNVELAYHRFPDARAARGPLAAQPSDFLVAYRGRVILLEVKETVEKNRLPRSKISQYGKLQMFYWAGLNPAVLVFRSLYNDWVLFDQTDLFTHGPAQATPTSFSFEGRTAWLTAAAALSDLFY